jgi:leucyl aminopeptidase (aminopeptidase T)
MKSILMMKTAQMIVHQSARIQPGENVCIVGDTNTFSIAKVLAEASYAAGAETVLTLMTPREMHGNEPPPVVASAMLGAEVVLAPTTYAITHTKARLDASRRGARTIILRGITEDSMIHGAMLADYIEVSKTSNQLATRLSHAETIRLFTDSGTDVTFRVQGRRGLALGGIATEPGTFTSLPSGEAAIAPLEGKTQGIIMIDFAMDGIGLLSQPIRLEVMNGKVVSIEGGREAQELRKLLEADENALHIAEFAVGTNPKSRMKGNMAEDKILRGCVHIAVGDNHTIGGTLKSSVHLDGVILNPTVEIDSSFIVKKGLLLPLDERVGLG